MRDGSFRINLFEADPLLAHRQRQSFAGNQAGELRYYYYNKFHRERLSYG